jgi:hypothetical protein
MISIAEPSKSRTVTVGTLPYQVLLGVIAKLLQPAIVSGISRTGLLSTRNLWEALYHDLDPSNGLWVGIRESGTGPVYALSSDLEEATDYGDIAVARQILAKLGEKLSRIDGFPTGLYNLVKTLFLGKRLVIRTDFPGKVRYFVKRNGWLMGDRLTKVILTIAHEIGVRDSRIPFARICGDDVVALSKKPEDLHRYQKVMVAMGFKISEDDHFVSKKFLFYCEEAALVPQNAKDLPSIATRRKAPSCYVDYPRIRLLIPVKVETISPSYTDIGRFSLLGKETRWIHQNGSERALDLFSRASLIQHIVVPQPADTLCPFLPHQLGGDGAFPMTEEFMYLVFLYKSRDASEVAYRVERLLHGGWGFRYLRNENLNEVVQKYHMMVPKLDEMKSWMDPSMIITGDEHYLGAIKLRGLESPEKCYFRLYRSYYWYCVLQGWKAPVLEFPRDNVMSSRSSGLHKLSLDLCSDFFRVWRDSGFTFKDNPSFLVIQSRLKSMDYLGMGYSFRDGGRGPEDKTQGHSQDSVLDELIESLRLRNPPPERVRDQLHRYVESDSYLIYEFQRAWSLPKICFLISKDKKLANQLALIGRQKRHLEDEEEFLLYMIDPEDYLFGYVDRHIEKWCGPLAREPKDYRVFVDFGQTYHIMFNTDPTTAYFEVLDVRADVVFSSRVRLTGVYRSHLIKDVVDNTILSLTTQPLDTIVQGGERKPFALPNSFLGLSDPRNY